MLTQTCPEFTQILISNVNNIQSDQRISFRHTYFVQVDMATVHISLLIVLFFVYLTDVLDVREKFGHTCTFKGFSLFLLFSTL